MSVICFGELIIDFTSMERGKSLWRVEQFQKNLGGAPANVAIGLHHHGVPVKLWSKVGKDSLGRFLIERLDRAGLSTDGILQDAEHPTKMALVAVDRNGERRFEFHNRNSADEYMRFEDFKLNEIRESRLVHFGGVALLGDVTANTLIEILKISKRNRLMVSFDPNIRMDLVRNPDLIFSRLNEILNFVDILKLSRDDWKQFFPSKKAADIFGRGVSLLILTEGAKGVRLLTEQQEICVPATKVEAVDTTGAGDAFTAAFLAKLVQAQVKSLKDISADQLNEWGEFANLWASRIVQYPGAVTAYLESAE